MSRSPLAIKIDNVAKRYNLGSNVLDSGSLKENVTALFRGKKVEPNIEGVETDGVHWALKGVSFEVEEGEVVGIIGRNGAGKSTLLKILSRVTAATRGRIEVRGRMSSLLEVGTGFHPELTGRENIFLNGAILGMKRWEIEKKFDEIVAFSEIDRFLDTPVKRYSSGMRVRLAFAVAAHLDPDILVIDEVLAVGDGAFQKKCLGKLKEAGQGNRTVLFVSHSMQAVRALCTRVIVVNEGEIIEDGPTDVVLSKYNRLLQGKRDLTQTNLKTRLMRTSGDLRFTGFRALDSKGEIRWEFEAGEDITLELDYEAFKSVESLGLYILLNSAVSGEAVTTIKEVTHESPISAGQTGTIQVALPGNPLRPGDYTFYIAAGDRHVEKLFDIIDEHLNLPWLTITSEERDIGKVKGYFSIPAKISCR